jgi:hypothetical protein
MLKNSLFLLISAWFCILQLTKTNLKMKLSLFLLTICIFLLSCEKEAEQKELDIRVKSSSDIIVKDPVSEVVLYPNPFEDIIHIETPGDNALIRFFDNEGRSKEIVTGVQYTTLDFSGTESRRLLL